MFLSHLKIGWKMGLAFGFLLLMILLTILSGLASSRKIEQSVEQLAKGSYQKTVYATQASEALKDIAASIRMLVLLTDQKAIDGESVKIDAARKRYQESMAHLVESEKSEKGVELLEGIKKTLAPAVAANEQVVKLAREGKHEAAVTLLLHEGVPLTQKVQEAFDEQLKFQQQNVDQTYQQAVAEYGRAKLIQISVGILSLILGLLAAGFLIRNFVTRINRVAGAMSRVADGDLSTHLTIYANDEIGDLGRSINSTLTSLGAMIATLKHTASDVAGAADSLHSGSQRLAVGVEEVAAQACTVATASEEMAATSSEIAHSCTMAAQSSNHASELATEGAGVVQKTVTGMERIAQRVKETAVTVERLGARSDDIGAIVATIEDIADQTNLLALNAAIEAARAGEQGRGFAVVADEVRALAERTSRATKEIGQMIRDIQSETRGAVASMEEGVSEVARGTTEAGHSRAALEGILKQINTVTSQIQQIATAAEEQTATTSAITQNIHQITEVVQESAAYTQESAAAATQLSGHSEELQRMVGRFTLAA